jgi:hypothetical protein
MGISAFLVSTMAKEKEKQKCELRPVDEEADTNHRFVRLGKDSVEEIEELPPVRVGERISPDLLLNPSGKEDLRTRSIEPDVGSLIEREVQVMEESWATEATTGQTFAWGWVALVACVFAAAILWSLTNLNKAGEESEVLDRATQSVIEKEKQEEIDAETQVSTIERAVRNFFDSRSVEEMLRYVRHPERVRPLMEGYYAESALKPLRFKSFLSLEPLTIDHSASYWAVFCELEGAVQSQLMLESASVNEAKVDWETFVCYQPMDWDEFAKSRPEGYTGDFRVYVKQDELHSHEFSDSSTFDCYRLTALNGDEVLFGYVPRGLGLGLRLDKLTAGKENQEVPMLLRLHVPKDIKSPQGVVIREIVIPRWFFMDNPKEEEP